MKKNILKKLTVFMLVFTLVLGSTVSFADSGHWQIEKSAGNIDLKVSTEHPHKMVDVRAYLNAKYGMDIGKYQPIPHINIVLELKGAPISNAHIVKYMCPRCGKVHYLVYDHILDQVTYDTPCDDDDDEGMANAVWDNVKENFDGALDTNNASMIDTVNAAALYLLVGMAVIAILVSCPAAAFLI